MSKTLTYFNKQYCLSFEGDTVFLDVEVEITRNPPQLDQAASSSDFVANVIKCQFSRVDEAFPIWVLKYVTPEGLSNIFNELQTRLLAEMTPNLFSYFYSADDNETTTHTD